MLREILDYAPARSYWIFDFQDGGIFTRLGVQHTHTICIFHREIDILKDVLALAARTERID